MPYLHKALLVSRQTMPTVNENITEYLDYYLSLTVKPGYAILLRGKWGCGKSWYMKNYIATHSDFQYLYVSLYGVTSYKEIEDSFFEQIHPVLASKGMKFLGKVLKGVLKTTIKVDLDRDGKEDGNITSGIPDINLPDYLKNIDAKVLVFDDLERCALPISNVLGYINQFVETNGQKVILLANEEEIIREEKQAVSASVSKAYLSIKEKLIGKNFDVQTDYESALDDFIKESLNQDFAKIIEDNKLLIRELFDTAGYNNLRHLRQTILDMGRFYLLLPDKAKNNTDLMHHLISLFFAISFEVKKGTIVEEEIIKLFYSGFMGAERSEDPTPAQKIRKKYSIFSLFYYPIHPDLWTTYFKTGFLDAGQLNTSIESSYYFKTDTTPNWIKLWHFYDLDDSDFEKIVKQVYEDFKNHTIDDKYVVLQITALLLSLNNLNLVQHQRKKITQLGIQNINKLKNEKKLKLGKNEEFPSDASHGLGYMSPNDPDFKAFIVAASKIVNSVQMEDYSTLASILLDKLETSVEEFEESIIISNSPNNLYYNIPILKFIPVSKFISKFLLLSNPNIKRLAWAFEKRYEYDEFNVNLKDELAWLTKVSAILEKEKEKRSKKVSGKILEFSFLKSLNNAIVKLQKYGG